MKAETDPLDRDSYHREAEKLFLLVEHRRRCRSSLVSETDFFFHAAADLYRYSMFLTFRRGDTRLMSSLKLITVKASKHIWCAMPGEGVKGNFSLCVTTDLVCHAWASVKGNFSLCVTEEEPASGRNSISIKNEREKLFPSSEN
jgi:hypothetical protein